MLIEPVEHPSDGCEIDHRFTHRRAAFIVLAQPTIPIEPAKGPLNNPALWQDMKAALLGRALDNLEHEGETALDPFDQHASVTLIGPHALEAWQRAISGTEQFGSALAIRQRRRAYQHHDQQAQRINQDVPLASLDLLARIEAALLGLLGRFHTLAIDNRSTRLLRAAQSGADAQAQGRVDPFERAIVEPFVKVVGHMLPGRQIMRQHAPLAAAAIQIQDGVHDLAQIDGSFAAWSGWLTQRRLEVIPFVVAQIACVGRSWSSILNGSAHGVSLRVEAHPARLCGKQHVWDHYS